MGIAFNRFVNGRVNPLAQVYTSAYNQLIRQMNDFAATPWSRDRATAMLAQVDQVIAGLDATTQKWIKQHVPDTYFALGASAKENLRALKLIVPEQFGQIHQEAVSAMMQDATLKFGQTMTGIKRSAQAVATVAQKTTTEEILKLTGQQDIRNLIGVGQLTGASAEEIAKQVKANIEEQGITALVDRGGKNWQLDTYSEMLARQILANSGRGAVKNTAAEYGFDLAQITDSNSDHQVCADWEGEIISLGGETPGYPTLDDAEADGLFHVGCVHGYYIVSGIQKDSPADFTATLEEDHMGGGEAGDEIPFADKKEMQAFKDMRFQNPTDMTKTQWVTMAEGDKFPTRFGQMHRWVDDQELQSIIDTGELTVTPSNEALGGTYYGRAGHKDFDVSPDGSSGKVFLDTLRSTSTYNGTGMHHLILNIEDLPEGAILHSDPKTTFSVMLKDPIPRENLSLVESIGSKITPGASIDWRKVSFEGEDAPIKNMGETLLKATQTP